MKRVFLYAYDKINLGDDLFIRTIVERYPHVQFYMWSSVENKKVFRTLRNLKIINKSSILVKLLNQVRPSLTARYKVWWEHRCNAVVYIGGSIFIEYASWENMVNWWKYEAKQYPFFVLGANFGPYSSEAYRMALNGVFENMQDVCFRDRYSYEKFSGNRTVRYAPDILFNYPMPKAAVKRKQLFISVICCAQKKEGTNDVASYEGTYTRGMADLIENYILDGYRPVLVSFCKSEGDEEAVEKILAMLSKPDQKKCRTLFYVGDNSYEVLKVIAESEYIIASRFHAAVLGLAAHRPVFPVIYSDKTEHILQDIGFTGNYIDIRKMQTYDYAFSRHNLDNSVKIDIDLIQAEAEGHFDQLDKILM